MRSNRNLKKKYRTIINNGSTVCHRTASYQWKIKELLTYLLTYLLNIIIIYNIQDNVYGAVIMAEPPGSPGSFDECRTAPSGRRPKTKPDDLGCESALQAARIYTHHRHLLLLLSPKADTHVPSHRG